MKDLIKLAAFGVAGYFIGFYEMKYKVTKGINDILVEQLKESTKTEDSKEEEA